jgi:hypothetical protein
MTRRNLAAITAVLAASVAVDGARSSAQAFGRHWWRGGGRPGRGHRCFLAGTRIMTPAGKKAVESLRAGDLVVTRSGEVRPIVRVETTTVVREAGLPWPHEQRPVKVARGALGPDLPARDLYLSSYHALLIDGLLVTVGSLVNGRTITVEDMPDADHLDYLHVELEQHDVLLAEGAACETLLADSAGAVAPYAPVVSLTSRKALIASRLRSAAAPIADMRRPVDVIRDRLDERAFARAAA